MPRITDKSIRSMPAPAGGQKIERDDLVTGFGVRKTASGYTAFIFNFTTGGRDRRMTIGQYPAWSVTAARQAAARLRMQVDAGVDPLEQARVGRSEYTLAELWERYEVAVLPRKAATTQRDERSIWRRLILPTLGRRKLSHIRRRDVDDLIRKVSASRRTLHRWVRLRKGPPSIKIGRSVYYRRTSVDRWLRSLESDTTEDATVARPGR